MLVSELNRGLSSTAPKRLDECKNGMKDVNRVSSCAGEVTCAGRSGPEAEEAWRTASLLALRNLSDTVSRKLY